MFECQFSSGSVTCCHSSYSCSAYWFLVSSSSIEIDYFALPQDNRLYLYTFLYALFVWQQSNVVEFVWWLDASICLCSKLYALFVWHDNRFMLTSTVNTFLYALFLPLFKTIYKVCKFVSNCLQRHICWIFYHFLFPSCGSMWVHLRAVSHHKFSFTDCSAVAIYFMMFVLYICFCVLCFHAQ
jgi:hypothetical protein